MSVVLFSEVDRHRVTKKIQSEYPAWYFKTHIKELQESIDSKKRELALGIISPVNALSLRETVKKEESRLSEIDKSRPKLSDKETDDVAKVYKTLGKDIGNSMFSRTDMKKGLADAHQEASRMIDPCIKVNEKVAEMADACGIEVKKGMISRNQASRIFKITGRLLEEQTDVEALRRDRNTVSSRG